MATTKKTAKKLVKKASTKKASTTKASTKKASTTKPSAKAATRPPAASSRKRSPKASNASAIAKAAASAPRLVEIGAPAPDFRAPDASGKVVTRASLKGKSFVLYFYPKDDTPGCTVEACDFRDRRPDFAKLGCPVLGVSPDSPKSHKAFDAKHRLGLTLLADEPGLDGVPPVAGAYGVWQEKSMYGKTYMGIVRTTYVVDAAGKVAARFDRVKVDGHADEVLAAVRALA